MYNNNIFIGQPSPGSANAQLSLSLKSRCEAFLKPNQIGRYKSRTGSTRTTSPGRIDSDQLRSNKKENKIGLGSIKKIKLAKLKV